VVVRSGGGDGPGAVRAQTVGDDELPLADRRPAAWCHTGADRVRPPLAGHAEGVFSSTTSAVDWNARLVTGDAVTEITRLKTEDGGPMDVGGATLAAVAMRAGLIDEYAIVTHPVLVGGGTPFFTALDNWVNLNLVETRTFPDGVLLTRYETRR
jgi:dihydrofolate reductase